MKTCKVCRSVEAEFFVERTSGRHCVVCNRCKQPTDLILFRLKSPRTKDRTDFAERVFLYKDAFGLKRVQIRN